MAPPLVMRVQNSYGDALRAFKIFLDKMTRNTLTKVEWNFGAKPLEYHYMMDGHESFEYPNATIEIQDIQPVDGVSAIARNAGFHINYSPHQTLIAENLSRNQTVTLDKRWVNLMFMVQINTEDLASLLNYYDLIMGTCPLNYYFFDYKYISYTEVTPYVEFWNFETDDIQNVSIRPPDVPQNVQGEHIDSTYRYEPNTHYKEANPNEHFHSISRDRERGRDIDTRLEGYRYFSMVELEPILKIQSIQKNIDKENQKYNISINFEMQIEIPNLLIGEINYLIETIEIVIDTANVTGIAHEYPLLTDMEEKFLINKNIERGIILLPENFVLESTKECNTPETGSLYLEIGSDINLDTFTVSLWAVEDVTEASSKRFFIPLEHAIIERVVDENGKFVSLRFHFKEMEWFEDFNFKTGFNFLKLLLFTEGAKKNRCAV
jgi:hypothetical protein